MMVHAEINADNLLVDDSLEFTFGLGPLTSNWYGGTKLTTNLFNGVNAAVPVYVENTTAGTPRDKAARAYSDAAGLIHVIGAEPGIAAGTYDYEFDFHLTCKLA